MAVSTRLTPLVVGRIMDIYVEPIYRSSAFMGLMRQYGNILYNQNEDDFRWLVRHKRHTLDPMDDIDNPTVTLRREPLHKRPELGQRGYTMGNAVGLREKLIAKNKAITPFDLVKRIPKLMQEDFNELFRLDFYNDGNSATGDAGQRIHGVESFFSYSGLVGSTGTCGAPNDSYAGLNTALQDEGGEWTGTWPDGTGDPEYHYWSPMIVDYHSRNFTGITTYSWTNCWQQAVNFGWHKIRRVQAKAVPDVVILDDQLLLDAKNSLISAQTFEVTQNTPLAKMGQSTVSYNGMEFKTEYGVPANVGYIFSLKNFYLLSMQPNLLGTMRDSDIRSLEDLMAFFYLGNMLCKLPSGQVKLVAASAAGT
jgi:hypothetical protein